MSRSAGRSPETEYRATLARIRRQVQASNAINDDVEPAQPKASLFRRACSACVHALRDVALPFVLAFGAVSPMTPCAHAQCASSGSSPATVVVSHGG